MNNTTNNRSGTDHIDTSGLTRRDPLEVLTEHLAMTAGTVLDIGCGDGWLVRALADRGHDVTGIEPSSGQLALAHEAAPVAGGRYLSGAAEALPGDDASVDVAIFFNSLHHVPGACMEQALREAARVLRPGGLLYVQEPVAEGPGYELCRPVDDERDLYARARDATGAMIKEGLFTRVREQRLLSDHRYADFKAFCAEMVCVSPEREQAVHDQESTLRAAFEHLGKRKDDGWYFDQVLRIELLRKA